MSKMWPRDAWTLERSQKSSKMLNKILYQELILDSEILTVLLVELVGVPTHQAHLEMLQRNRFLKFVKTMDLIPE